MAPELKGPTRPEVTEKVDTACWEARLRELIKLQDQVATRLKLVRTACARWCRTGLQRYTCDRALL